MRVRTFLLAGLLALNFGCSAPPDVRPFADATAVLFGAVSSAGQRTAAAIRATADLEDPDSVATAARNAEAFERHWSRRTEAMRAMCTYADELSAIVAAGNNGAQAAQEVATSVSTLLQGLGAGMPVGGAVDGLAQAAQALFGEWAKQRAADVVEEAVLSAQPYVRDAAEEIARSFAALLPILDSARTEALTAARASDSWQADAGFLAHLEELRRARRLMLVESLGATEDAAATTAAGQELAELDALYDMELKRGTERRLHEPLERIDAQFSDLQELVIRAGAATRDWAAAHVQIAAAAQHRQSIEFRQLVQVAREVSEICSREAQP